MKTKMDNNLGLSALTLNKIINVLKENPAVQAAKVYGSRAKGNYKNGSDIDICLLGNELKLNDQLELVYQLDELLLPYTFDLSIYQHIENEKLTEHIERVGIILYEKTSESLTRTDSP